MFFCNSSFHLTDMYVVQVGEIIGRFEKKGFYLKGNFPLNDYDIILFSIERKTLILEPFLA